MFFPPSPLSLDEQDDAAARPQMTWSSLRPLFFLQATCERGFAAMEESHQKVIEELQRKHQRELENLREEKERLLEEETAATIAGKNYVRWACSKILLHGNLMKVLEKTPEPVSDAVSSPVSQLLKQ